MLQAAPAFGSTFESRERGSSPSTRLGGHSPNSRRASQLPSMPRVRPSKPGGSHDTRQAHEKLVALHRARSDVLPELRGEPRGTCKKNKVGEHLGIGCRHCFDRTGPKRGQAKQKTRNKCLRKSHGWPGEVPEVCVLATPAARPPAAAPVLPLAHLPQPQPPLPLLLPDGNAARWEESVLRLRARLARPPASDSGRCPGVSPATAQAQRSSARGQGSGPT